MLDAMLEVFGTDEADPGGRRGAPAPYLAPLAAEFDPENTGGAMLLGVDGVCVISHGSSSAVAMANAIKVAHDLGRRRPGRPSGRPWSPRSEGPDSGRPGPPAAPLIGRNAAAKRRISSC